jgi:hypothetical protein
MSNTDCISEITATTKKSILDLSSDDARNFFLKPESYSTIELPPYIEFSELLSKVNNILGKNDLASLSSRPDNHENVNYTILSNKDGKYAWRPLQLIHPALYVSLVHKITERNNWNLICKRFNEFSKNKNIQCLSLPVVSMSEKKNKEEQILQWWLSIEQKAIELSLDYEYLIETDISDCYGSIYTHSIVWALHGKETAKQYRNDNLLVGNIIDKHIQSMQKGQTNGIPQGSVLMDFIAEIVLGYTDSLLSEQLQKEVIDEGYFILRYRDDYRIFINNPQIGELILKLLTGITYGVGMKINPAKTKTSSSLIQSSIKDDKLSWITKIKKDKNLQKHLLIIHNHAKEYPNSGSISRALDEFNRRLVKLKKLYDLPVPLIAIIVDIALLCPRTYPVCTAILSKLLSVIVVKEEKGAIIERIRRKFNKIPNIGHLQIWLQRLSLSSFPNIEYDEPICNLITGKNTSLWNSDWISSNELKKVIDARTIVNDDKIKEVQEIISIEEIELFTKNLIES